MAVRDIVMSGAGVLLAGAGMFGISRFLGSRQSDAELGLPEREPEPQPVNPAPSNPVGAFGGMRIIVNPYLTKRVPLFPDKPRTKRRMRRVIGKYGRWDKGVPTYLVSGNVIMAHPAVVDRIRAAFDR